MNSKAYMADSPVDRLAFDSAKTILNTYFVQHAISDKYMIRSMSDKPYDSSHMIDSLYDAGIPLVYWMTTTMIDAGIGSYYVSKIQLRSDTQYSNAVILRAACIQSSCVQVDMLALVDKVCVANDTKHMCDRVSGGVGNDGLYGLYLKLTNLGMHGQPASKFKLVLSNKQKMIKLFMVTFGDTVMQDESKTIVKLAPGVTGTYDTSELIITGMHISYRLRAGLREKH